VTGPRIEHRRRATLLLLALCIGIATVIYLEVNDAAPDSPENAPTSAARNPGRSDGGEPSFSMPPLRSYADVLLRPLFSPTRRPPRDSAAVVTSSGFTLVGIVKSAHESHALIEHGKPPRLDRVAEDQELDGWTVEAILEDRVLLRHADARLEVKAKDTPPNPAQMNIVQPPPPNLPKNPVATATSGVQSGAQVPAPK
jgi:hypothetical protein